MLTQNQMQAIQAMGGWKPRDKMRVVCCDDGLSHIQGLHYLASGVLQRRDYLFNVVNEALRDDQQVVLSWHKGCGWVAHRCGDQVDVDSRYADRAVIIAEKYDWRCEELEIQRPVAFHPAKYLYYDATGLFHVRDGIPNGFLVSRRWLSPSRSLRMTEFLTDLALGPHGFRHRGSRGHFTLVAVTSSQESELSALAMPQMLRELRRVAEKFEGVQVQGVEIDLDL